MGKKTTTKENTVLENYWRGFLGHVLSWWAGEREALPGPRLSSFQASAYHAVHC